MKKAIVIIRGKTEDYDTSKMQNYIEENEIEVLGEYFYDYRTKDSNWAFERYEDRLAFLKGIERGMELILVESNFFCNDYFNQENAFEQELVQEVISKIGYQLVCIDDSGFLSGDSIIHQDAKKLLDTVKKYEKLRLSLSRIRTKYRNEEKGILNLKGTGKINGRKSYLETDRELVKTIRRLKLSSYTHAEVAKTLFDMGYRTKNDTAFDRSAIGRIFKQSDLLSDQEKTEIAKSLTQ